MVSISTTLLIVRPSTSQLRNHCYEMPADSHRQLKSVVARSTLQQSRSSFEAQVNEAIYQVVTEYWAVVQARGILEVQQKSVDLAQASYAHDKRALELGALSPLDIYRPQSEVASRHLAVIQNQYALKEAQEDLRLSIGAEQETGDRNARPRSHRESGTRG